MIRYLIISLCLILTVIGAVFAQEIAQELAHDFAQETEIQIDEELSDTDIYFINSFLYESKGMTRAYAMNYKLELKVGEEITGSRNLEKFIQDKTQILVNERLFEIVEIEHTIGEQQEDGRYPVDMNIYVKESWNILAIPIPKYDSNNGFEITIKFRDNNFLGTMNPLRLDLGYRHDTEGKNYFNALLDLDFPFFLFGLNWNVNFDNEYVYRQNLEKPHFYKNTTGISVEIPVRRMVFTLGFTELFIVNEEMPDDQKPFHGNFFEGLYMSSRPSFSWGIPLGKYYYDIGEFGYSINVSATFNHEISRWPLPEFKKGPFLYFSHGIGFGRIDWRGNFRRGLSVNVGNSYSVDFYNHKNDINPWGISFSISATGHTMLGKRTGFSSRITYNHYFFNNYNDNAGSLIRGIRDGEVHANYILAINFDLPILIFTMKPSTWSQKEKTIRFLRVFDLDFHLSPILDIGMYKRVHDQAPFGIENMLIGAGLEAFVFPLRFRSYYFRVSFAVGLQTRQMDKRTSYELFFGLGHFY